MPDIRAIELAESAFYPDPATEAGADQMEACQIEIDQFFAETIEREPCGPARLLLPSFLLEIRKRAGDYMTDYRERFDGEPVPYEIDPLGLASHTVNPRGDVEPVYAPIAVFRDGTDFHRVFCCNGLTLERVYDELTNRRLPAGGDGLPGRKKPDPGCDLNITPDWAHRGSNYSADLVWPIQRGQFVIFLRYCGPCWGALMQKYEIGQSRIIHPWESIG